MKTILIRYAVVLSLAVSSRVIAQTYQFDVEYYGNGTASLATGSDDPSDLLINPGDSFTWNITADGGSYWLVEQPGGFFPLMAFAVSEQGSRTGDYILTLSYHGSDVFTESKTDELTEEVHVGTNTITLAQGIAFDRMRLDFILSSSIELESLAADPSDRQDVPTTLNGILPIFGAPEMNQFSPGISYVMVPEPTTFAMLALTLVLGTRRRR